MAVLLNSPPQWQIVLLGNHANIAALPFETGWGRARLGESQGEDGDADLTILLDPPADPPPSSAATVVWHPGATSTEADFPAVARPWPVADDLFESAPSPRHDACLVIASESADADAVVERLRERQFQVSVAAVATRELLAQARIVVSLTHGLPAETFAILAAGRLLVAPAGGPTFGLQPWIDHVAFSNEDDLVEVVDALVAFPESWTPIQAFARQAAEPHRARQAIGRLVRRMQVGA